MGVIGRVGGATPPRKRSKEKKTPSVKVGKEWKVRGESVIIMILGSFMLSQLQKCNSLNLSFLPPPLYPGNTPGKDCMKCYAAHHGHKQYMHVYHAQIGASKSVV